MIIIPLLCLLGFGLVVSLIGLYVLAYSKKEALGKAYRFTSYATITVGALICFLSIMFAVVASACHTGNGCYGKGKFRMRTEMHGGCSSYNEGCGHHSFNSSSCEGNTCGTHKKMKCEKTCSQEGKQIEKEVIVQVIEEEDDDSKE